MGHAASQAHRESSRPARRGGLRVRDRALAVALGLGLIVTPVSNARASEPLMNVLKSTILGSVTGLLLGGTLTLVVDEGQRADTVRWGVVIGTFAGCGVGIWQVARGNDDLFSAAAGWAPDALRAARDRSCFEGAEHLEAPGASGWGLQWSLLRLSW